MDKNLKFSNLHIGDQTRVSEKTFSGSQVRSFQKLQGNHGMPNKLACEKYVRQQGLPEPLVPGAMSIAFISQHIGETIPEGRIKNLDIIFRRSVKQETNVFANAVIVDKYITNGKEIIECDIFLKDSSFSALAIGKATLEF